MVVDDAGGVSGRVDGAVHGAPVAEVLVAVAMQV